MLQKDGANRVIDYAPWVEVLARVMMKPVLRLSLPIGTTPDVNRVPSLLAINQ